MYIIEIASYEDSEGFNLGGTSLQVESLQLPYNGWLERNDTASYVTMVKACG